MTIREGQEKDPRSPGHVNVLVMLRDAMQSTLDIAEENKSLRQTLNEQSQIIAALVLDNGGNIKGETWDTVHSTQSFCPYVKKTERDGIVIELKPISKQDNP